MADIAIRGIEKRYQPSRCYMFIVEVTWKDGSKYIVYRSYSDIFNLQLTLAEAFPIEAGEVDEKERILPKLRVGKGGVAVQEARKVAEKRVEGASQYFGALLKLEERFTSFPGLLSFFDAKPEDLEVPKNARTKKENKFMRYFRSPFGKKGKRAELDECVDVAESVITGPLQADSYKAVAAYKSKAKGEVSFNEGDAVEVIDKNATGWWFVRIDDQEGWAPSSYLDPILGNAPDEQQCLGGETFITIKSYEAQMDDELSFPAFATVEVMNKILDGWWIASYGDKVGYVPSTYLKKYSNPHLTPKPTAEEKPRSPAPRRQTIKGATRTETSSGSRDLKAYSRISERRKNSRLSSKRHAQRRSGNSTSAREAAAGNEDSSANGLTASGAAVDPAAAGDGDVHVEQYRALADYQAAGQGEVSLHQGDVVDVTEKNDTGWWFVKIGEREGWAPSSYLDSLSQATVDEQPCFAGETFVAIVAYSGQLEDELSFPEGACIEIMNKILDGWWIGSYGGLVGYVPSTYLKPFVASQDAARSEDTLRQPAPRRMTIRGVAPAPERDLSLYCQMSTKRRQRTLKKQRQQIEQAFVEEDEDEVIYENREDGPDGLTLMLDAAPLPTAKVEEEEEDFVYEAVATKRFDSKQVADGKPPIAPKPAFRSNAPVGGAASLQKPAAAAQGAAVARKPNQ